MPGVNLPIKWIKVLFVVVGVSELLCGTAFSLAPAQILHAAGAVPPDPLAYIQFPALLIFVYGVMFLRIAADPFARREQILYGIALKAVFCSIVFWYWFTANLSSLWLPFAWIDVAIFFLFILAWKSLARLAIEPASEFAPSGAAPLADSVIR